MKSSNNPTSHVPLTCRAIRVWASLRSENAPAPRHLETCESCQEFTVSIQQLHHDLHRFRPPASSPPVGIEGRIIDAVRRSAASPRPASQRSVLPFAVAGGLAVLACVGVWHFNTPFPGHPSGTASDYTAEVTALVSVVRAIPVSLSQSLTNPTAEFTQDNSLGREVENVYSDAQSALDFLSLNFLPGAANGESVNSRATLSAHQT